MSGMCWHCLQHKWDNYSITNTSTYRTRKPQPAKRIKHVRKPKR
jgi:hypothetical protein